MARILVVDDSIVMRKNLNAMLTEGGHEVVGQAINGKQAVNLYIELKPDLVTMDISMPLVNGVDAVNQIINIDSEAKVIMISALNQKQMVFEALNNGATHYIIKPIEPSKLLSVINDVLTVSDEENIDKNPEVVEVKIGFKIENVNGVFEVFFNKDLGIKDHIILESAIKGLLFIKPLNIVFDFNEIEDISDEIMLPIIRIANSIKKAGETLKYKAKNQSLLFKLEKVGIK